MSGFSSLTKLVGWILAGLSVTGLAFWMITADLGTKPLILPLVVAVFAVPPIGAFWMLYMAIRYEKNPLPMMMMAFIPYGFLWYYFERVRTGKFLGRKPEDAEPSPETLR